MSRLRQLLVAAAALVLGGLGLDQALHDAGQAAAPKWNCSEWAQVAQRYSDLQQQETFYVAVPTGSAVPSVVGDRVLGDCAGGVCTIKPASCSDAATWTYKAGAPLGGKVIIRARAPLYVAEGLRRWVGGLTGGLWLGSFGQAVSTCLSLTTAANCRTMLGGVSDCWLLSDGRLCRYGRLYGPGEGGASACPALDAGARPMPCEVSRGAGSELADVARAFNATDLSEAQ